MTDNVHSRDQLADKSEGTHKKEADAACKLGHVVSKVDLFPLFLVLTFLQIVVVYGRSKRLHLDIDWQQNTYPPAKPSLLTGRQTGRETHWPRQNE